MMEKYKNKKVVAAGHICLDITPSFEQSAQFDLVSDILIPGRLVPVGTPDIHIGGSAGNTGLALKRLGADVSMMGKIGRDDFGRLIKTQLEAYGMQSKLTEQEGEETSYSVVLSVPGIDRIILHNSGANHSFTASDIDFEAVKEASLFHFGYPSIMRGMYRDSGRGFLELFKKVKSLGTATSLDMAIVEENSESGKVDWTAILQKVMPYVDVFAPSMEELAFLIDRPRYHDWMERSKGREVTGRLPMDEVKPLANRLFDWGAKIILIKCGASGMYLRTGSQGELEKIGGGLSENLGAWANQEVFEKSYKPERVVSAAGAGDTSIAAFLCALLEGCSFQKALQLAAGTGASCVETYDALSGLKSLEELEKKIAGGWEKI